MKMTQTVSLFVLTVLLVACSSAESDWKKADTANTAAAYQDFLTQHPNDTHAGDARDRLNKLQDARAWMDAQSGNTLDAYREYLQKQPSGAHVQDAQQQISALNRAADWKTAQAADTAAALQDFLKKYTTGPEVEQAKSQLQQLTAYRVQLATSRDQKAAEKSRHSLQTRFNSEVHALVVVPPAGSEKLYRIASEPMSEADANAACSQVKKAHQHCEVVKS